MPSSTLPVKRQAPKQHGPVPSVRPEPSGGLASDLASWASSATQLNLVREKVGHQDLFNFFQIEICLWKGKVIQMYMMYSLNHQSTFHENTSHQWFSKAVALLSCPSEHSTHRLAADQKVWALMVWKSLDLYVNTYAYIDMDNSRWLVFKSIWIYIFK